ncbi:hypothetical protein U8L64_10025 [Pseudomonas sp. FIP_A4]|uniref:hypothetical protein n=1 Tax=Pseudomonas sp. FIP_A4 TaxID=3070684 RepID=UPI0010FF7EBC|nr:hypothetical protein [Stutzerimonas degradans]QCT96050.1 hypothetical protein FEV13_03560 [Stutzerimonas degradans]
MFEFEKDRNPIRFFAVIFLLLLGGLSFYLYFGRNWSITTAFNLIGIVCNAAGALWIASGVYLFSQEKEHLQKGNPTRNKYAKKLAELLVSASRVIPLGVLYILLGSTYQAFVLIGTELKWFPANP